MKKIASLFLVVAVFVSMLSITTFAAADENVFTITTDKAAYAAGEEIIVTVTLTGDFKDVAVVNTNILFDSTKVTVDTGESRKTGLNCIDKDWYDALAEDYENNLGYITDEPTPGGDDKEVTIGFISTKGYIIDEDSNLYTENASTETAVIKATAVADIAAIDDTYFKLGNCYVAEENTSRHVVTLVQLVAEEEEDEPETIELGEKSATAGNITIGEKTYSNVAVLTAKVPEGEAFSEVGFAWANGTKTNDYDVTAFAGEGEFEFSVAVYGVPAEVENVVANAYYVTDVE